MSNVDKSLRPLMDSIFLDKVRRARERSMSEKVLDGPRLFDECCAVMRAGIRSQFPEYSDDEVETEFRRRLAIQRQIDEAGIYRDVGMLDEQC